MKIFFVTCCLLSLRFPLPSFCFNSALFKGMILSPDNLKSCHTPIPAAAFHSGLLTGMKIEAAHGFLQNQHRTRTSYKQWGI